MLWSHPKEIMSQINICFTTGIEALSNTVGQLQLSRAWTCLFLNFPLLTQVHSEQLAPRLYRGHSLARMHWTGKKVSGRSPGGVHSNGEHWALHGTGACEHLLGHVPLFALINAGLDKQARVCLREFQPRRRNEPGHQYPLCWGLHLVLVVHLQAELWGEAWAWGKRLWNCQRTQGRVVPARFPEGAKGFRHDSAWIVLVRV